MALSFVACREESLADPEPAAPPLVPARWPPFLGAADGAGDDGADGEVFARGSALFVVLAKD